jgi:TrpR family trp operon transcriptional repressor
MTKTKEGWKGLIELCIASKEAKDLSTVLELMLTPEEKESLAMRFSIIKELLQGKRTQRDIAHHLGVSIAKITRGSNEIKRMNPQVIQYLKSKLTK